MSRQHQPRPKHRAGRDADDSPIRAQVPGQAPLPEAGAAALDHPRASSCADAAPRLPVQARAVTREERTQRVIAEANAAIQRSADRRSRGPAPAHPPARVRRVIADFNADVQLRAEHKSRPDAATPAPSPQAIAAEGFRAPARALPFADRIQASFGSHDVSGIKAHVGGAAAEASDALGARAYASGQRLAFAREPDLFLAAHEAAHVVQQRAGVSLKGGLGEAGDPYEEHADAVATEVVAGRSAEALLSQPPGGASTQRSGPATTGSIQKKETGRDPSDSASDSAPAPRLRLNPTELDFGDQRVNQMSSPQRVQITNPGDRPVYAQLRHASPEGHYTFIISKGPRNPIPARNEERRDDFAIRFTPRRAGALTDTLTLTEGVDLRVKGTGRTAEQLEARDRQREASERERAEERSNAEDEGRRQSWEQAIGDKFGDQRDAEEPTLSRLTLTRDGPINDKGQAVDIDEMTDILGASYEDLLQCQMQGLRSLETDLGTGVPRTLSEHILRLVVEAALISTAGMVGALVAAGITRGEPSTIALMFAEAAKDCAKAAVRGAIPAAVGKVSSNLSPQGRFLEAQRQALESAKAGARNSFMAGKTELRNDPRGMEAATEIFRAIEFAKQDAPHIQYLQSLMAWTRHVANAADGTSARHPHHPATSATGGQPDRGMLVVTLRFRDPGAEASIANASWPGIANGAISELQKKYGELSLWDLQPVLRMKIVTQGWRPVSGSSHFFLEKFPADGNVRVPPEGVAWLTERGAARRGNDRSHGHADEHVALSEAHNIWGEVMNTEIGKLGL